MVVIPIVLVVNITSATFYGSNSVNNLTTTVVDNFQTTYLFQYITVVSHVNRTYSFHTVIRIIINKHIPHASYSAHVVVFHFYAIIFVFIRGGCAMGFIYITPTI